MFLLFSCTNPSTVPLHPFPVCFLCLRSTHGLTLKPSCLLLCFLLFLCTSWELIPEHEFGHNDHLRSSPVLYLHDTMIVFFVMPQQWFINAAGTLLLGESQSVSVRLLLTRARKEEHDLCSDLNQRLSRIFISFRKKVGCRVQPQSWVCRTALHSRSWIDISEI